LQTGEQRELGQPKVRQPSGRELPITLAPLQVAGAQSLNVTGLPRLKKITLVEVELLFDNDFYEVMVIHADDVFACASQDAAQYLTAFKNGRITRAIFIILFSDGHSIPFEIRIPNTTTCTTAADAIALHRWLVRSEFTSAPDHP
jgi:hypothetical protein